MGDRKDIILFTGQSGIKAMKCLERLRKKMPNPGMVDIKSVEKKMSEKEERSFKEILLEKPFYQSSLWRKSFEEIIKEIKNSDKKVFFLTFHGVYYHPEKREFISPINPSLIMDLKDEIRMLIVLIDDIYDIYLRLMEPGELYANIPKSNNPRIAFYESIHNLITILEWRQVEITISRLLSYFLKIPLFIVATKHPAFMIARLLSKPLNELKILYLSHPITSVRNDVSQMQNFPGELNNFAQEVINSNENIVLFIPTTIDELRIKKGTDGEYIPELLRRWSDTFEPSKLIAPKINPRINNPINPLDYKYEKMSPSEYQAVSSMLRLLSQQIMTQVTSRDLSLVEQSKDGVIAYRPYFPDTLSGGVTRELEYNQQLYEAEEDSKRVSLVFSVQNDMGRYRIQQFLNLLKSTLNDVDDKNKNHLIETIENEWLYSEEYIALFANVAELKRNFNRIREDVEDILGNDKNNYSFISNIEKSKNLQGGTLWEQEKNRSDGWSSIHRRLEVDPIKKYMIDSAKHYLIENERESINIERAIAIIRNILTLS